MEFYLDYYELIYYVQKNKMKHIGWMWNKQNLTELGNSTDV